MTRHASGLLKSTERQLPLEGEAPAADADLLTALGFRGVDIRAVTATLRPLVAGVTSEALAVLCAVVATAAPAINSVPRCGTLQRACALADGPPRRREPMSAPFWLRTF